MTQFYYLSAKIPLEGGFFGETSIRSRKGHPVRSGANAAGIYIENIEAASIHMKLPYQVQVHTHIGTFAMNRPVHSEEDLMCLKILFSYIKDVMKNSFSIEWYTAWAGEEDMEISKKRELVLSEFTSPSQLILEDREYLRIVQKKWQ